MAKGKGIATEVDEVLTAAEKEESHVFNPPASSIPDNVGLVEYLMYYNGRIGDGIKVTLAPARLILPRRPRLKKACISLLKFWHWGFISPSHPL